MEPHAPDGASPVIDAEEFHRRSFDRMDRWEAMGVAEACQAIWQDHAAVPSLRLAAAFWLVGPGAGPAPGEVLDLLATATDVPPGISLGVRSEVAAALVQVGDADLAGRIAVEVLDAIGSDVSGPRRVEPRQAAAALRNVAEVLDQVGDPGGAGRCVALLDELAGLPDGHRDRGPVEVLAAISSLGHVERRIAASAGPAGATTPVEVGAAVERLARSSTDALGGAGAPMAVHGIIEAAQRRIASGDADGAAALLRSGAAVVPSGPGPAAMRSRLHMLLADALDASEGPAAALDAQRVAVDASVELGVAPVEGWARRGLAHHLAAVGRLADATAEFELASGLLARGGDPIDVWALRLSWARTELLAGDAAAAARLAAEVLGDVDGDAGRARVEHDRSAGVVGGASEDLGDLAIEALDVAAEAAWIEDPAGAETHLVLLADRLGSMGRPTALARSNAGRAAARAGHPDRAEEHLDLAFEELRSIPPEAGERLNAILLWRRSEVRWAADRNEEAAADADAGHEIASRVGDELLSAQILAMGARARHDAWVNASEAGEPAEASAREAEDSLVHAVQLCRSVDDDATADELGPRLEQLRAGG